MQVRLVPDEDVSAGLVPEGLRGAKEAIAAFDLKAGTDVCLYTGIYTGGAQRLNNLLLNQYTIPSTYACHRVASCFYMGFCRLCQFH